MKQLSPNAELSIIGLPAVVTNLFERAHRPLLAGTQEPLGLFVRYLRRKPARGLAVIYAVDRRNSSHNVRANDPKRAVSLTLDEQALDGAHIRFTTTEVDNAALEVQQSGVLRAESLGLSVQAFPADGGLPHLATSCNVVVGDRIFTVLEDVARKQLRDSGWQLVSVEAEPVRYKPASRCVIRYHLILEHQQPSGEAVQKKLTLFGKVYADTEQARTVNLLQERLYDEQRKGDAIPLLPHPLGCIDDLGLTFNEAVQPPPVAEAKEADIWASLRTGTRALQAHMERGRGGTITKLLLPEEELRLTGEALARLHTSGVQPNQATPRSGAKEAKRARERAALIASRNAGQAEEVQRLAGQLASRLDTLKPDSYRPAHGGFKASQLLFHSHRVFVVDFDGFCLADPALDVGYFLAYLRPSGLWYAKPGMREWFEAAAALFRTSYTQAMLAKGVTQASIDGILARSRLYEAALLFKIATRRVNRLNSPRPHELAAMLLEIFACLSDEGGTF